MNRLNTRRHGKLCILETGKFPTSDTLSRAGAHWRSHAPASDPEQQQWDVETYKHWLEVIKEEEQNSSQTSRSGLAVCATLFFLEPGNR